MALLYNVALLFFFVTICSAAVLHEKQLSINNTCNHEGTYHEVRSVWQGTNCTQLECRKASAPNTVILTISSCGTVAAPPDCTISFEYFKPYPDCCMPIIKC